MTAGICPRHLRPCGWTARIHLVGCSSTRLLCDVLRVSFYDSVAIYWHQPGVRVVANQTLLNVDWRRFHDSQKKPPRRPDAVHCPDEALNFIDICKQRPATGLKLKAAGSHWSLS